MTTKLQYKHHGDEILQMAEDGLTPHVIAENLNERTQYLWSRRGVHIWLNKRGYFYGQKQRPKERTLEVFDRRAASMPWAGTTVSE